MLAVVLLAAGALTGCDDEPIRQYQVGKERDMRPADDRPFPGHPPMTSDAPAPPQAAVLPPYTTPEAWRELPAEGMRAAAFEAGQGEALVTITAVHLPGGLDVTSNVNRWLRQLQRDPVDPAEAAEMLELGPLSEPMNSFQTLLRGQIESTAVVMIESDGGWWYLKATGPVDAVEAQMPALRAFARSIEFQPEDAPPTP